MNNKYRFPSSGAAPINPAYSNHWTITSAADRVKFADFSTNTALSNKNFTEIVSGRQSILNRQYVSDALGTSTILPNSKFSGQVRCSENSGSADFYLKLVIRTVDSTGAAKLTLYTGLAYPEYATGILTNRSFNGTLNTGQINVHDRLVVEMGTYCFNTVSTPFSGTQNFGENATGFLPINSTSTAALNPWIEFNPGIFLK